jgi:hypothetical protein
MDLHPQQHSPRSPPPLLYFHTTIYRRSRHGRRHPSFVGRYHPFLATSILDTSCMQMLFHPMSRAWSTSTSTSTPFVRLSTTLPTLSIRGNNSRKHWERPVNLTLQDQQERQLDCLVNHPNPSSLSIAMIRRLGVHTVKKFGWMALEEKQVPYNMILSKSTCAVTDPENRRNF